MKASLKNVLGWGSILALIGFTSAAIAGPGPQFWQEQAALAKARADAAKKSAVAPAKAADTPAMSCTRCKTTKVQELSNFAGKFPPSYRTIGSKHECAACGGTVATVRGKTTNEMKDDCPICAKAKTADAVCCNVKI